MQTYLDILSKILKDGKEKPNRTGIDTLSISGYMFEHDMSKGFPLLTTKKMGLKNIAAELEFFIKGLSDKQWLKDRNCHIWDSWCNPKALQKRVGSYHEQFKKHPSKELQLQWQLEENDLGPIYGVQWRSFNGGDVDQLSNAIYMLKNYPTNRRIVISAWNPEQIYSMALPPCHYSFQLLSDGVTLDLLWNQRSVDTFLG